jgi:ribonuclease HII
LRKKLYRLQKSNNSLLDEELKARLKGYSLIAGIDEAGRGPLAGPVVACSVVLKDFNFSARIDDSKRLQPSARERAYKEIADKAFIGIGIVAENIIDEINIYRATILAMERSILNLKIKPDFLLIDGNIRLRPDIDQLAIVSGDRKSLSIACASIVAKVTRDRLLRFYDSIFPGYGFNQHKGYGTERHISAIIKKGFSPIHRRSFSVK